VLDPGVDHDHRREFRRQRVIGIGQIPAVEEERLTLPAQPRGALIHDAGVDADEDILHPLAEASHLQGRQIQGEHSS